MATTASSLSGSSPSFTLGAHTSSVSSETSTEGRISTAVATALPGTVPTPTLSRSLSTGIVASSFTAGVCSSSSSSSSGAGVASSSSRASLESLGIRALALDACGIPPEVYADVRCTAYGNVSHVREARIICLGDGHHENAEVQAAICKLGHACAEVEDVWLEEGIEHMQPVPKEIEQDFIKEGVEVRGWDDLALHTRARKYFDDHSLAEACQLFRVQETLLSEKEAELASVRDEEVEAIQEYLAAKITAIAKRKTASQTGAGAGATAPKTEMEPELQRLRKKTNDLAKRVEILQTEVDSLTKVSEQLREEMLKADAELEEQQKAGNDGSTEIRLDGRNAKMLLTVRASEFREKRRFIRAGDKHFSHASYALLRAISGEKLIYIRFEPRA